MFGNSLLLPSAIFGINDIFISKIECNMANMCRIITSIHNYFLSVLQPDDGEDEDVEDENDNDDSKNSSDGPDVDDDEDDDDDDNEDDVFE